MTDRRDGLDVWVDRAVGAAAVAMYAALAGWIVALIVTAVAYLVKGNGC